MSTNAIKLTVEDYIQDSKDVFAKEVKAKNDFSLTGIDKISINIGVGKYDNKQKDKIADYLMKMTSQKPMKIKAKKSVSDFKVRKGDVVGLMVTLRGAKAINFLMELVYIALPRGKDFKGISSSCFDKTFKTYSIGIPTSTIFPTVGFDTDIDFGLQINIVFKNQGEENKTLLEKYNFPFKKQ